MRFKHYDSLRVFIHVAQHGSFSAAAEPLNRTKGAVSHQIRLLQSSLGFALFDRLPRGVKLTSKGEKLLSASIVSFTELEDVINNLQRPDHPQLTLGVTTYFASRWLSQRLMNYMQPNPELLLRLQPMIDLSDLEGREFTGAFCGGCHSLNLVKQQGLTREGWDELLHWMTEKQNMPPVAGERRDMVLDYLAANFNTDHVPSQGSFSLTSSLPPLPSVQGIILPILDIREQ